MTENEKRIVETCKGMLPRLSEREKADFLKFTEGMAFLSERRPQLPAAPTS